MHSVDWTSEIVLLLIIQSQVYEKITITLKV